MDDTLKNRIYIAIGYRLVSYIAGYNISIEWGSSIGSKGFKETERILKENDSGIELEELYHEIFREFIFRFAAEKERQEKKRATMQTVIGESDESKRKIYQDSCTTFKAYKEESSLNESLKSIANNINLQESEDVIEEVWGALLNGNKEKDHSLAEAQKLLKALNMLEKQKNDSGYKDMDLGVFQDRILNDARRYTNLNTFQPQKMNENEKDIVKGLFEAKLNTINPNNERARAKDTIYDKINKGKIDSLSLYDFERGLLEIIGLYGKGAQKGQPKRSLYLIETQYNLGLYVTVALEIVDLGLNSSKVDGLLEAIQDILIYANCLNGYGNISEAIHIRCGELEGDLKSLRVPSIGRIEYKFEIKERVIWDMPESYNNNMIQLSDAEYSDLIDGIVSKKIEDVYKKVTLLNEMILQQSTEKDKVSKILKKIMANHKSIIKLREDKIKSIIGI